MIHFVIDSELLAPSNIPLEIHLFVFDCVSQLHKVPPQCNDLFIICHHSAAFNKITFCSALQSTPLNSPRKAFRDVYFSESELQDARKRSVEDDMSVTYIIHAEKKAFSSNLFRANIMLRRQCVRYSVHFVKGRHPQTLKS